MPILLIEPHYLGCIEYFVLLNRFDRILLEVSAHYQKQSYKNRAEILTSNGVLGLTVPVKFGNRTPLRDVRIDHSGTWKRDHWGAFYSAYGKAPFFEFFADYFRPVWDKKHSFLIDLNIEMMSLCLHLLQIDREFTLTDHFDENTKSGLIDLREQIHPKKLFEERKIYLPFRYAQNFGSNFAPNLSIVDLLMCVGNEAKEVILKSTSEAAEHLWKS